MSTVRKIAKNTGIIITGDIINKIISLFVIIYMARYLGAIGYGKYSFALAFLSFFGIIVDLGINTIIVRDIARDKFLAGKLIGNASAMKLFLSIIAVAFAMILIRGLGYPEDTKAYVDILSLTLAFGAFGGLYSGIFQVNLRMEYGVVANLVDRILSGALIVGIIISKGTLLQIIIAITFSKLVSSLIIYLYSKKFIIPRLEFDLSIWKYLLKESWPLAFTGVFVIIYYRIDQVMLSKMIGDEAVGYYSAAVNLVESLGIIPMAFMASVFPLMSEYFQTSKDSLKTLFELNFKYMLFISLLIAIGTTLLSNQIITMVYGNKFFPSVTALSILIWAEVFMFMNLTISNVITSINKQNLHIFNSTLMGIINIILNFILIPLYGFNGASVATVITELTGTLIGIYWLSRYLYNIPLIECLIIQLRNMLRLTKEDLMLISLICKKVK